MSPPSPTPKRIRIVLNLSTPSLNQNSLIRQEAVENSLTPSSSSTSAGISTESFGNNPLEAGTILNSWKGFDWKTLKLINKAIPFKRNN